MLENVDKSHKIYQICQKGENYYLRTISYLFVTADMNGYYIETQTNLQEIFEKRDDMTKMYHYIVLIVLICCAVLSFVISYLLTYRVRALSVTARALPAQLYFSQGKLLESLSYKLLELFVCKKVRFLFCR